MEIINQIGHLQHWGISPAVNFLQHFQREQSQQPIKVLLSGTSDIRHILKTLTDIDIEGKKHKKIQIYYHETKKQLLARAILFLHIIHETNLNFEERVQLYLDLYGNALIKQRNSRYLNHLILDLLNFIHGQKKVLTPIKKFVSLKMLKFQQRDEISQIFQSWSNKVNFDIQTLRDQRLRYLYKERYDYRSNLVDWDFSMLLGDYTPLIHYYHFKQWRLTGLAFQQRFSTYCSPNKTLASYAPGRKKQQKTSCLVRGYWGDVCISPYISMGIDTNSQQKQLLFKKSNMKHIGHSVQLTQYNLTYWLQRIETGKTYKKIFRDYYRTDEEGRKKLQEKDESKKRKKNKKSNQLKAIKEEEEEENTKQEEMKQKQEDIKLQNKKPEEEDLDSDEEVKKAYVEKINSQEIKITQTDQILAGFSKYGVQVIPLGFPTQDLSKAKYKSMFDIVVLGFIHSGCLAKDVYDIVKSQGQLLVQTSRYLVPKKKEQRKEIDDKLRVLIQGNKSFKLVQNTNDYLCYQKKKE